MSGENSVTLCCHNPKGAGGCGMAREEIYITDIADMAVDGDCVRCELVSGKKHIVLRGSRHTLVRALGLGIDALKTERTSAVVLPLPEH